MSTTERAPGRPVVTRGANLVSQNDSRWDAAATGRQTLRSPAIDWDSCYVYIGWGHDRSRPLYVGKSREPLNRIGRHLRGTAWAADVVEWDMLSFDTEGEALLAEARAIRQLNPIHNVSRGSGGGPRHHKYRPRANKRGPMATMHQAIPRPIHGISKEQLAIIRRVQGRGRAA